VAARRRRGEQRLSSPSALYIAIAIGVLAVTGVVLAVTAITGWTENGDDGERIDFSDFEGGLLGLGAVDNRRFHARCPTGRVTVEFTPDSEVRITQRNDRFIASLRAEEASVGCSGALEDARGKGFYVAGLSRTRRPVKLECVTFRPIDLVVHPIFRYESDVYGGSVILATQRPNVTPLAIVISSFTEDGRSDLHYRPGRCRITED
jgi:hypothetical protein